MNLTFEVRNSAFEGDNYRPEIARILRGLANKIDAGDTEGKVKDVNGNTIGNWSIEDKGGEE